MHSAIYHPLHRATILNLSPFVKTVYLNNFSKFCGWEILYCLIIINSWIIEDFVQCEIYVRNDWNCFKISVALHSIWEYLIRTRIWRRSHRNISVSSGNGNVVDVTQYLIYYRYEFGYTKCMMSIVLDSTEQNGFFWPAGLVDFERIKVSGIPPCDAQYCIIWATCRTKALKILLIHCLIYYVQSRNTLCNVNHLTVHSIYCNKI